MRNEEFRIQQRNLRTEASVKHKAQSLGHNAYAPEDLYTRTLAKCFHCDSRVIIRWMDKYGLKYYSVQRGKASCKLIEVKEFWKWAENHKDLIPWNKYEPLSVLPEPSWSKTSDEVMSLLKTMIKKGREIV